MSDFPEQYYNNAMQTCDMPPTDYSPAPTIPNTENKIVTLDLQNQHALLARMAGGATPLATRSHPLTGSVAAYLAMGLPVACNCDTPSTSTPDTTNISVSTAPQNDPWNLQSAGNRHVIVEIDGDPNLGTVVIFRQWHANGFEAAGPTKGEAIAAYQYEMLQQLESLAAQHVFAENIGETGPALRQGSVRGINIPSIIRFMGPPPLTNPNLRQRKILYSLGAATVYSWQHPDITLHHTLTTAENRILVDGLRQARAQGRQAENQFFRDQNYTWKEDLTTQRMIEFLRQNPGEKIVLIFGITHEFKDNFEAANFLPRVLSIYWDVPNLDNLQQARERNRRRLQSTSEPAQ